MAFADAKQPRPVEDPSALVAFGWAPGEYHRTACSDCRQSHSGTDKRSSRCQDCAEKLRDNPPPPLATMTAVDHAELKRLAEAAQLHVGGLSRSLSLAIIADNETKDAEIESLKAEKDGWIRWADEKICEAQAESLALLSEIEGLKAERDGWIKWADEKICEAQAETLAHLSTQAPDSWRPIETAPKDGTVIDVWREDGGRDTVFWGLPHHDCGEMGRYCDSDWHGIRAPGWVCSTFNELVGRNHNPFTHWMPLPAAPALRPQTAESGK